jgi:hypothetical protein
MRARDDDNLQNRAAYTATLDSLLLVAPSRDPQLDVHIDFVLQWTRDLRGLGDLKPQNLSRRKTGVWEGCGKRILSSLARIRQLMRIPPSLQEIFALNFFYYQVGIIPQEHFKPD